jgi:outer membrane protein TolC
MRYENNENMKKSRYIMVMLLLIWWQYSFSQLSSDSLGIHQYLKVAAENNPGVKASFTQYLAALQKVPQFGALPDPQASMNFFLQPMEQVSGNQVGSVSIMQMFPWFGTLKSSRSEASLMAKAKYQQFEADKADLFYRVKSSWYLLNKYNQEIKLVEENLTFLQSFEKLSLVKFQSPGISSGRSQSGGMSQSSGSGSTKSGTANSGMGGMNNNTQSPQSTQPSNSMPSGGGSAMGSKQTGLSDVLRIRMEILDQQNRLSLLKDQLKTEQANFNSLLNRKTGTEIQLSNTIKREELPVPVLAVADSMMKNNPMLSMNEAESQSYAAMAEKSRKMGLPMIGLGVNYMFIQKQAGNTSMMNGKDMIMPMINFTIPIYRKKYKAMQKEAELLQESAQQKSEDLKNSLQVQYHQIMQNLNDADRRIKLNKDQADLAKKTTSLLLTGYTSGTVDFEELIRMQYKVLDYKYQGIEAVTDYNTSVASAEKLMNDKGDAK